MGIINFKNFQLNEKVGLAEPTLFYTEPIFNKVWNEFLEFYQSDDKKIDDQVNITYTKIRPNITDKVLYAQFPVVGIEINTVFNKMADTEFEKKYKYIILGRRKEGKTLAFSVGGWAIGFGKSNWAGYTRKAPPVKEVSDHGLILSCVFSIDLSPNFNMGLYKKKIQDELEECIWHELNHLYEYYNRILVKGKGRIETKGPASSITAADVNKWGIPNDVYNQWMRKFTFYLYASEPHELNAQVQEAAFWVNKYGPEKITKTEAWKMAKEMENFKSEAFIKELDLEINKYIGSRPTETTLIRPGGGVLSHPLKERLKNMWVQQYEKSLKEFNETPTIPLKVLKKMKCDEFVKYFEKRINDSGIYLRKKLGKLYSIAPEEDNF